MIDDNINKAAPWFFVDAETIGKVRERYVAGEDVPAILAAYGLNRRTLARIVKQGKWFAARQRNKDPRG